MAAAQLQIPTIRTMVNEIISGYNNENVIDRKKESLYSYAYLSDEVLDRLLYTYDKDRKIIFTMLQSGEFKDEPLILRLIYDMVDNNNSIIEMPSLHDHAYAILEKYGLMNEYNRHKVDFDKKAKMMQQSYYHNDNYGGGRRSKRSHHKTRKGKSRKHRSKGGRRGKSRKH